MKRIHIEVNNVDVTYACFYGFTTDCTYRYYLVLTLYSSLKSLVKLNQQYILLRSIYIHALYFSCLQCSTGIIGLHEDLLQVETYLILPRSYTDSVFKMMRKHRESEKFSFINFKEIFSNFPPTESKLYTYILLYY